MQKGVKEKEKKEEKEEEKEKKEEEEEEGMTTASSRIRGLHAVTRQLPRVKRVKTETWVCFFNI